MTLIWGMYLIGAGSWNNRRLSTRKRVSLISSQDTLKPVNVPQIYSESDTLISPETGDVLRADGAMSYFVPGHIDSGNRENSKEDEEEGEGATLMYTYESPRRSLEDMKGFEIT